MAFQKVDGTVIVYSLVVKTAERWLMMDTTQKCKWRYTCVCTGSLVTHVCAQVSYIHVCVQVL